MVANVERWCCCELPCQAIFRHCLTVCLSFCLLPLADWKSYGGCPALLGKSVKLVHSRCGWVHCGNWPVPAVTVIPEGRLKERNCEQQVPTSSEAAQENHCLNVVCGYLLANPLEWIPEAVPCERQPRHYSHGRRRPSVGNLLP